MGTLKRLGIPIAGIVLGVMSPGCANRVTDVGLRQSLIFRMQVGNAAAAGEIEKNRDDIRYLFVVDTSGNDTEGPRSYGPWILDKPTIGWDFPVYIFPRPDIQARFAEALAPNVWTDLFVYSRGQVNHWKRALGTNKESGTITLGNPLSEGQEWRIMNFSQAAAIGSAPTGTQDTLEFTIPFSRLFSAERPVPTPARIEVNLIIQRTPPVDAVVTNNEFAGPFGWKTDQWNQSDAEFFSISVDKGSALESKAAAHGQPFWPQNAPFGLNTANVSLKRYSSEVKGL